MFYYYMAVLRDKRVSETGITWISYCHNSNDFDFETFTVINEMEEILPMRAACGHICACPDSSIHGMIAGIKLLSSGDRYRLRAHFGSIEENHFELQTYGILTTDSPMKNDGTWSTEFHMEWVEGLRLKEEILKKDFVSLDDLIVIPRKHDVLCGKSQRAKSSFGTQRALHLVEMHRDRYESKNKNEKTSVATDILSVRFLKSHLPSFLKTVIRSISLFLLRHFVAYSEIRRPVLKGGQKSRNMGSNGQSFCPSKDCSLVPSFAIQGKSPDCCW